VEAGSEISLYYDPMLAKLIVWAPTRPQAIERMHRALLELTIDGVDTSRDFHLRMMENDDFRRGAIDIQWLEQHLAQVTAVAPPHDGVVRAAIAAALLAERDRSAPRRSSAAPAAPEPSSAWLRAARLEALR
jgi:acetyl-CoA carboxylase biotin carboxylase subunit